MKQFTFYFYFFFCACLFSTSHLAAQAAKVSKNDRYNVVKTNLLSPLSVGYERGLGKHFSLTAYALYLPSFHFGTPEGSVGYVSLADPSKGLTVEARFYTSQTKETLNGFYVGGYSLFRVADVFSHKITVNGTSQSDIKAYIPSDLTSYGLMIGKQKIGLGGFTTDFNFGVGYYTISNIPVLASDSNSSFKLMNKVSKLKSGIGPRLNFCLGYGF
jgi:hypothetical protein